MALKKEVIVMAIALDVKKKVGNIVAEIEKESDLLVVADKYEEIAAIIRKMEADIREVSDDIG